MALAGCTHPHVESLPPAPPAAVVVKDTPPAELLACPTAPAGFPQDETATIGPEVRAAIIRLAGAFRAVSDQLGRLIAWEKPDACPAPKP